MSEPKTQKNDASVEDFVAAVVDDQKRQDAQMLLKLFKKVTGHTPQMWGSSIIGYDQYHYKSERSKQEGDWPMTGFSPRKTALTIYVMSGVGQYSDLLLKLGKFKTSGGSCLYIQKLADVDLDVLEQLVEASYQDMQRQHPT